MTVSSLGLCEYVNRTKNLDKRVTPRNLFEERYGLGNCHVKSKSREPIEQVKHMQDFLTSNKFGKLSTGTAKIEYKTTINEKAWTEFPMVEKPTLPVANEPDRNCNFWNNAYSYYLRAIDDPFKKELHYISQTKYSL